MSSIGDTPLVPRWGRIPSKPHTAYRYIRYLVPRKEIAACLFCSR